MRRSRANHESKRTSSLRRTSNERCLMRLTSNSRSSQHLPRRRIVGWHDPRADGNGAEQRRLAKEQVFAEVHYLRCFRSLLMSMIDNFTALARVLDVLKASYGATVTLRHPPDLSIGLPQDAITPIRG